MVSLFNDHNQLNFGKHLSFNWQEENNLENLNYSCSF